MIENAAYQIEVEAAQALAEWKAFFAERVAKKAKEIASNDGSGSVITLGHYRQAASAAAHELAMMVQDIDTTDGNQKAA